MNYIFPDIKIECPLCRTDCGGRWKGYFVRQIIHMLYLGPLAIHVGHCVKFNKDFSYMPDFILPGRKFSRPCFELYLQSYYDSKNVKTSIDQLLSSVKDDCDLYLPLSTAYDLIYQSVRTIRINAESLAVIAPKQNTVFTYLTVGASVVRDIFSVKCLWHPFYQIIIQPP